MSNTLKFFVEFTLIVNIEFLNYSFYFLVIRILIKLYELFYLIYYRSKVVVFLYKKLLGKFTFL